MLIAVGLALIVYSDNALRVVTGTAGFARSGGQFAGNFTSRQFSGNLSSSQIAAFRRAAGTVGLNAIESLAGIGLVGAGLLLEIISALIRPTPSQPKP